MKWFLLYVLCFSISGMHAQEMNFEQTVSFIKKKIHCCSVPFAASTSRKVDSILIERNGDVRLSYSDKNPTLTFNIFELYSDEENPNGIDTVMGGKFVQFYINEEKIRMIRFASAKDAGEVYAAFMRLYTLCRKEQKMFSDLNFKQTVDVINIRLAKWAEGGADIQVIAKYDGDLIITHKKSQTFRFNLLNLSTNEGIEAEICDVKRHAPRAWIHFRNASTSIAFIRLHCNTPDAELEIMRAAFLHLKSLCRKNE